MTKINRVRMTGPTIKVLSMFLDQHPAKISGADIMNEKKIFSGTLYPLLDRLEKAGWLKSHWEAVDPAKYGRPRRRLYKLTAAGQRAAWRELQELGIDLTDLPGLKGAPA